jgi:hypothetical protein
MEPYGVEYAGMRLVVDPPVSGLDSRRPVSKTFDAYDNPSSGRLATSCCISDGSL